MVIIGTFEQSIELEQALAALEKNYVHREHILVVFMEELPTDMQCPGRTRDIRSNSFEVGIATATGSAVIGASKGFELALGPIIWGLIAAFTGFIFGYGIYYFYNKKKYLSKPAKATTEVTVIINCKEHQAHNIKELLWKYRALSVGTS